MSSVQRSGATGRRRDREATVDSQRVCVDWWTVERRAGEIALVFAVV